MKIVDTSFKLKNSIFGIFTDFGGKNVFQKKSGSVTDIIIRGSSTMPKFREM